MDSIFAQLQLGIAFDKQRFKKDVSLFEVDKSTTDATSKCGCWLQNDNMSCMSQRCMPWRGPSEYWTVWFVCHRNPGSHSSSW